jgi:hypothetical protein
VEQAFQRSVRVCVHLLITLGHEHSFHFSPSPQVKFYLYMFYAVVDDIETQRRGVVFVIWPGPTNDLQMSFPHPPIARFIRASLTLMVGRENRSRLIFDSGELC